MDGPNVNWAFQDILENYRKEEDPNASSLLNIGSFETKFETKFINMYWIELRRSQFLLP